MGPATEALADDGRDVVVSCQGITKTFGSGATAVKALRGIDLAVHSGEMLLLVGPSGCGKTTLLSIMGAMLDPDSGDCSVNGRQLRGMTATESADFRGNSVGFVFQAFSLIPTLTIIDNVAVPLLIGGHGRKPAEARAAKLLQRVGLADRAQALPGELSGGQQQRVALARALVRDPAVVICDEPTSNLDHETGADVLRLLRETGRAAGRALIVATHDDRVLGFADRIARLDDGRIIEVVARNGQRGRLQ
jgi:putative ABC transport system ATP-binding protein